VLDHVNGSVMNSPEIVLETPFKLSISQSMRTDHIVIAKEK
jgi:hypothetical protein